ncbi:glycosyl hydrolase family 43 [Parapedobacter defluvii]|uniref:Glycosyl hydrolase family 43 n=1 Tax=Parapedobacter defluvii TaxID=2045106 RepID=A0ABQ1L0Q6_9SPHI|nr:glycoside hydrolase family 43 protein [Parapedobacter defluvii]GGC13853.1 glycosyl hydrolase family 43 [Parapedobacter defluvii]
MQKKRQFIPLVIFMVSYLLGGLYASAQEQVSKIHIKDLSIRDPYILADQQSQSYILYKSAPVKNKQGADASGVVAYRSTDLEYWEGPYVVYTTPPDNWIKGAVWAPEVHSYQGKYYLFATLNSDIEWKLQREGFPKYTFRGTQLFYADNPMGPFLPFEEKLPHTPMDRMALDGTLWVENGIPYLIYCHEWVQIEDGTLELVQLERDLSKTVGPSLTLFHASSAPWSTGSRHADGTLTYVTDGCFLYRTRTGKLLMIWSSFKAGSYAIGIAESTTGKLTGPWIQQEKLLFDQNGGHGMLFKTFDGRLMLTFHSPNSPSGEERAKIYEVVDTGNTLVLKD